ncbi:MAG: type II toxin-antitoxin system VapC family toxin [Chloroflexota bacterium]
MILYLDTSSLVKPYLNEAGGDIVRSQADQADLVAMSIVAYPEARATFARRLREGLLTEAEYETVLGDFERDWEQRSSIDVTMAVARAAGELAEKHALRGFDAIHLASALELQARVQTRVTFSSADVRLATAAQAEGLEGLQ